MKSGWVAGVSLWDGGWESHVCWLSVMNDWKSFGKMFAAERELELLRARL